MYEEFKGKTGLLMTTQPKFVNKGSFSCLETLTLLGFSLPTCTILSFQSFRQVPKKEEPKPFTISRS